MSDTRKGWHTYFMEMAELVSSRSTCDRAHVGCVLVKEKRVLACGYNGSLPGSDHCSDAGHFLQENHCVRTLHAEAGTISFAAKNGIATAGTTLYCTHHPCTTCLKLLIASGITKIYYKNEYRTEDIPNFIKDKVTLIKFTEDLDKQEAITRKDFL